MTAAQARGLGDWIAASGKNLTAVFVTHGHGDHWFGLSVIFDRFPGSRAFAVPGVVVTRPASGTLRPTVGSAGSRPRSTPEDRIQSNHPIPPATTHRPRPTPERTTMLSHTTTTSADYLLRRLCDAVGSARYSAREAMATPSCSTPSPNQEVATGVRFCQSMTIWCSKR